MLCVVYVIFVKQKTAYERRISDWSTDVCSSDLGLVGPGLIDWCEQDARTNGGNGKHTQNKIFWRHGWGFLDKSEIRLQWTRQVPGRHAASEIGRASCRERVVQYV